MRRLYKNPYAWLFFSLLLLVSAIKVYSVNYATWAIGLPAGQGGANATQWVTGLGVSPATGISVAGPSLFGGNINVSGILTPGTFAQTSTGNYLLTSANVSVTTPTVAFAVPTAGANYLVLNTDTNQTGCYLTGTAVAEGQVILLRSGAGSNTMRFDDNGTTLALGANITLTEGQDDMLALICTAVQGTNSRPAFARLHSSDN